MVVGEGLVGRVAQRSDMRFMVRGIQEGEPGGLLW